MASVRLNRQAAHSGQLPQLCICCGAPARQLIRQEFYHQPTWLVILTVLYPRIMRYISQENFQLAVPVCESHVKRFQWRLYLLCVIGGILGLSLALVLIFTLTGAGRENIMLLPYGMAFLALPTYVIGWLTLTFLTPRVVAYSHHYLDLDGVADLFAQHVAGGGGYAQTAMPYPQPQPYTGNYGVTPDAYQNTYSFSGGSGNRTLWIVLAAVGGPILLLGIFAVGLIVVRENASYQRWRQAREMRRDFAETIRQSSVPQPTVPGLQRSNVAPPSSTTSIPSTISPSAAPEAAPQKKIAIPNETAFRAGDVVYFEFLGEWHKGTIVSIEGFACFVKFFRRDSQQEVKHLVLSKELFQSPPTGITAIDGPGPAEPSRGDDPTGDSYQVGDTVYFKRFSWHQATILTAGRRSLQVSYYDESQRRKVAIFVSASQLYKKRPLGEAVIEGPESVAETNSRPGFSPPQTASQKNPPGFAVQEASLKKREKIFAWWGSKWWDGEVVEARKGQVLVHYDGWGDNFDEWLPVDRVRLKEQPN